MLDKALGLKLSRFLQSALMLKNFSHQRPVWRAHFYFDPVYRNALSQAARSLPIESPVCLQIGAMFSLPIAFPDKQCISYHDGNLPERLASGFGLTGISRKRIDQALRYEEEIAQQMTAIFTFSEFLRQSFIRDYHVSPDKVFVVGGAVNLEQIPTAQPKKIYTGKRLLFVGVDFARKGGPQLLEAFAIVRQAHPTAELHIVGPTEIGQVPPGVVFHGRLSKNDPDQRSQLEQLFLDASLFVMPSLYEPFGIAPLEAMFYQLPCVVTNGWALREYVTPGVNGALVEKGSVEDIAEKLSSLLSNPAELALMGMQAREMVLSQFTWDAVTARMRTSLDQVARKAE
jgi:glycosyltransferase involved in cell wall biosynthesis